LIGAAGGTASVRTALALRTRTFKVVFIHGSAHPRCERAKTGSAVRSSTRLAGGVAGVGDAECSGGIIGAVRSTLVDVGGYCVASGVSGTFGTEFVEVVGRMTVQVGVARPSFASAAAHVSAGWRWTSTHITRRWGLRSPAHASGGRWRRDAHASPHAGLRWTTIHIVHVRHHQHTAAATQHGGQLMMIPS